MTISVKDKMKRSDQKYDEDENGKLDFREFSRMIESHRARYFEQIKTLLYNCMAKLSSF